MLKKSKYAGLVKDGSLDVMTADMGNLKITIRSRSFPANSSMKSQKVWTMNINIQIEKIDNNFIR